MSCSSCFFFLLLLMSFFHLCLSTQNFSNVLCKDVERQALLRFKQGVIDHGDQLASWVSEEKECCSWVGIVCDNFTGHVHQIRLRGVDGNCRVNDYTTTKPYDEASQEMLGGDISSSLLHLKQLRHLDLSCNDFGGIQIPSFMGSLANLRYLNLSSSRFGGIIPPQLGNLSELQVLGLGSFYDKTFGSESTQLLNMQWLSSLRSLHHLDMSGVDLSKAINWFQVMNTLPSLVKLHLSSCQLPHVHPFVPSLNITSLSLLDLSGNYFDSSFVPRWIFSITGLVSLDLTECNFHGPIPSSIDSFRNLTALKFLHVSGNDFMNSSFVLKGLSSIGSTLISLDISSCGVSSPVLDTLHNLTSLHSLDMSNNQLTKAIPKSLADLCSLRNIDLENNNFQNMSLIFLLGSIFECESPRLESLSLTNSKISGHLPDSIGRLSFLRSLSLSDNLISGSIPNSIGRLLSLEILDLRINQLNGSLPESIGLLSKLEFLGFSYNLLTGVVTEAHFAKLARLKVLWGTGNNLVLRPRVANWTPSFHLQTLGLNSWDLGHQFPLWLQFQRNLIRLELINTSISSTIPELFWRSIPNLETLKMSQNNFQGRLFGFPASLAVIDLSSNNFSGPLPQLPKSSSVNTLDLSNNSFVGSLHHLLCLYGGESLDFLNLANNQLSGVIPKCWVKWPNLSFLNLDNNNFSGVIPRTLGSLSSLGTLNMCNNKLSGRLPVSLRNLKNLEILQLARNELAGRIPTWFGRELSSLRILNLRSNKFDGDIPRELCDLTVIRILVLAHNNLSGNIPRCFNKFDVLSGKDTTPDGRIFTLSRLGTDLLGSASLVTKGREDTYSTILRLVMILDLSSNNFSGHIPSELMTLQALQSLNLSRNQLTGRISENIGDMKSLESFDISLNQLSGELPMSLSSLSFLSSFNVSYNNLTGRVPSSTQLQGFNESSFFGNQLCGDPLTRRCRIEVPDRDEQEDHDGSHGTEWGLIISTVSGFIVGFWVVLAPLLVSTSWRITYFSFLRDMWYKFYDFIRKYCCNMFPK
ncbi:receptor-like protein EIX2 [Cynara cardunculus var. scolymus]|uniref:receptor-like protein EIX2 n=1 Tax=Cynara cardunculus var. scolymus TaxID=59895 RepID=UPI000D62EF36|nr:receptor-like protein EIX2 [Cynara cardunculus var. scolymus]